VTVTPDIRPPATSLMRQVPAPEPTAAPLVLDLKQARAADLPQVGGKAANLGELIRGGFPVPPGFAITTTAYDRVVPANALENLIAQTSRDQDGAAIRDAFATAAIPGEIEQAIVAAYRQLGSGAVAVRSSATAEDLPDAAFAGQQDSFLGIVTEPALLQAVRLCWASLWSDRAIVYREKHGYSHADVKLAVVVQRLIAAESAGVMFTANPITGARNETVIDASSGLGEAIVSGLVTPDHVVLRRTRFGWHIVERRAGRHEIEIRARAGGGTEHVAGTGTGEPALSDRALRRLAWMGSAIQRHFGRPQDVEWAWAEGKLFILQARPITALPDADARPGRIQLPRGGPIEYFQIRPYPLDMTSWMPAMGAALQRMLPVGNALPQFQGMWIEDGGVVTRFGDWPEMHVTPDLLLAPLRMVRLAIQYDPAQWREDPVLASVLARVEELNARDLTSLTWEGLLATAREALAVPFDVVELRRRYFPRTVFALGGLRLALATLGRGQDFGELLSGIDNKTLEANRVLEELSALIRSDPELASTFASHAPPTMRYALEQSPSGTAFLQHFDAFLAGYGHRETGTPLLVSQPTWRGAPETVFSILKGMALSERPERDNEPKWEAVRDEILKHPVFQESLPRDAFLAVLRQARRFPALREDTHFAMTLPLPVLRRTFVEMGQRLAKIGVLDSAEDVFHLRFDELERLTGTWPPSEAIRNELKAAVHDRSARRAALADVPLMPLPAAAPSAIAGDALVAGTPGSPGIAEGPVRLVPNIASFGSLQPGEVLVAPYTNPSWTPLFGRAAAVIVDAGSAMSHAAIVAREYGIPAVMGTGDALTRLQDGQLVRVDGTRGLVFPVEPLPTD
jgi:phosphohistidine swiveling domain-containing protein